MIQLFTHTDLDGIGCAILAQLAYGHDNVTITYCSYNDVNEKVRDFLKDVPGQLEEIHITDISVNETVAEIIDKSDVTCRLLDHHYTALRLNKYKWCTVMEFLQSTDLKTSGTELYYLYLYNNGFLDKYDVDDSLRRFVDIVRDWDTWRWATMGIGGEVSKMLNDLFYLYGKEMFISKCINDITSSEFPRFVPEDNIVLNIEQKKIDDYVSLKNDQMIRYPFRDNLCGVVFADKYISELGNRLCGLNPDIDFVAMIDIGKCTISYRTTREDINLGEEIAKPLGGGGHPKAAGSTFSKNVSLDVIGKLIGF